MASLHEIVPNGVFTAEGLISDLSLVQLMASEREIVRHAVPKRQREFAAGRACARRALLHLGVRDVDILSGGRREPLWPPEIVGSIAHTNSYCAAAVALEQRFTSLGIDIEANTPLEAIVTPLICGTGERRWCEWRDHLPIHRPKLLFSIKESLFKALYPLMQVGLGFQDIEISVDLQAGTFVATTSNPDWSYLQYLLKSARGAFDFDQDHVFAITWISSTEQASIDRQVA